MLFARTELLLCDSAPTAKPSPVGLSSFDDVPAAVFGRTPFFWKVTFRCTSLFLVLQDFPEDASKSDQNYNRLLAGDKEEAPSVVFHREEVFSKGRSA
jgi:hypothetical protein